VSSPEEAVGHQHPPRLGHLLKHAYLNYLASTTSALEPLGISTQEWAALYHFTDQRPLSQVEAAKLLGMDRTSMVALIDELERKELVTRRQHSEDRRKNVIELTAAGHDLKRRAQRKIEACERRYLEALGATEATRFTAALREVAADPEH
jgi:DNA-binding MarR family transcriptional regulator